MHCVTPAPSQFEDLPVDASANMKRAENAVISDQLSSEIESDKKYLAEEARTINGLTFCQDYNSCNKSPAKGSIIRNRKSFNERDIDPTNKNIYRERHPHSRSTETILFHEDKDPNPIVPNKKPGTPDIWVPRTVRA